MADLPGYSLSGLAASFFFLLLTMKHPDDFRVVSPAFPILAKIGEDALLTCQLLPKRTAVHMEVRWYRSEPDTPVIARRDGAELTEQQMAEYRDRAESSEDGMEEGTSTLKIRNIQPSDDGQYWCRFQEGDHWGETSVLLQVAGLGSAPSIHMEGPGEEEVQLVCTAWGWFPEPQVYWEDAWGQRLVGVSENHVPDEDGLFYVEDTLVIKNDHVGTVSCFIHNPVLDEGLEVTITPQEKLQTELASLKAIGPSQPVLVRVGEDLELTCHLAPKTDAQSMEVRWVRAHRYPAVYVSMDGGRVTGEQMVEYESRTELVTNAIHEGQLTLQIHDTRASDDGQYRCLYEKDGVYQEASWEVKVIAVGSAPLITQERLADGATQLRCVSHGWFPSPQVQWRDPEGRTMPSSSEALRQDDQALFQVETLLWVGNGSVANVTCAVSNLPLGEERTTAFDLTGSQRTWLWKMLPLVLLSLVVAVILMRKKTCTRVNIALDPNIAVSRPVLSEEHDSVDHELSHSQIPGLTTCSPRWVKKGCKKGSR